MKKNVYVLFIILLGSVPVLASDGELNGFYEKIETDQYEINVYLPTSHYNIYVIELNYSIKNIMITNVVNFIINQHELQILQNSFTISGDSTKEYRVILKKIENSSNHELDIIEYLLSFLLCGIILFILYKLLTNKFKENNNTT